MDKNKIKSFAVWARRNLISSVSDRAKRIGITEHKIEDVTVVQGGFKLEGSEEIFKLSYKDREALKEQIKEKGFTQVMEETAYTWFNRFMGIRYMEVNRYLPSGIRVLSSEVEGKKEPDILSRVSEVIDELDLHSEYIYSLLDSGKTEDREEAYKNILVKQCNELGSIIPQMFEKISDYTELLLPDNLLEEGSVIRKMVEDIEEDDWKEEVEIIGWMYQYYISEKKDEVFAALKKNVKITKENIPAATQLFTPKWIVKYMVENSLGRLWLEGHPNEELQNDWKYYLEEAEQEPEVEEELKKIREEHSKLKPEDIKVLDPCMGSGHILVYAFDVLYEIYKTAGYSEREIPRLILQNNLYGLDLDDRAAQLASFALIMKARHYNRRLFREIEREHLELNLRSIQESNGFPKKAIDFLVSSKDTELEKVLHREDIEYLINVFEDAKEYGSILDVKKINFDAIEKRIEEIKYGETLNMFELEYKHDILEKIPALIKQAKIMSEKYEVCVTNPPYMGSKSMSAKLSKFVQKNFSDSKSDLFSIFIEKCTYMTKLNGLQSMITQHSWMFLSSYEKLRSKLMFKETINMIHLGAKAFEEISGEVVQTTAFVLKNRNLNNYNSIYIRLTDIDNAQGKEEIFLSGNYRYITQKKKFSKIPSMPVAYWVSDNMIKAFLQGNFIGNKYDVKSGVSTGDNDVLVKMWYEVGYNKISFANNFKAKWFVYNKGGGYRKWYGNNTTVVNWENDGFLIRNSERAVVRNPQYYFKEGITWSGIGTNAVSFRYSPEGALFDSNKGPMIFFNNKDLKYVLGYMNTKIVNYIGNLLNPTLSLQIGDVSKIPIIINDQFTFKINNLVENNISISKADWDNVETSWGFKNHQLLNSVVRGGQIKLNSLFNTWKLEMEDIFQKLKSNEEELNRIFINIYGLQDELTPDVEEKDISVSKVDRERDIKSFILYAVGCMLGRYSIDAEGLIYAGGNFKDKWNLDNKKVRKIEKDDDGNIISDSWVDSVFLPDSDNILPITEDEYFEDDVVSRFIEFVRTVYSAETLEENLDFIADSIGRKPSETSRQAIRRYFIKDFYKDHLKVYQKRPIYWMFESGKNDGFKALIYMHRYNEQTVAKVRTDYLHTLQRKYEAEIQRQQLIADSEEYTAKDRTAAKKKIERILKQIEECREYDQVVAHVANDRIYIDLDDGVKVNYEKFQGVKVINSKGKEVKMDLLAKI